MACVVYPIVGGFTALAAGVSHVGVNFEQALRFGQTRKRALALTLGLCAFEAAFALALGGLLALAERFLCIPLWARLARMNGWIMGGSGVMEFAASPGYDAPITGKVFENMAGELVPVPEKTLIVEAFTLDWYWWLLIQRFGSKGGWIIWGICFAPMILTQIFPRQIFNSAALMVPLLVLIFAAGLLWSIWSLLHAVVRA